MLLIEKELSINEALDIFNIDSIPSKQELKSIYKRLALKFHPDRSNEDVEMMYLINDAYDILSTYSEGYHTHTKKSSMDILNDIVKSIDINVLVKHLENYIYPLKFSTKEKHTNNTYDYYVEIYNDYVSFFVEYNFEIDSNNNIYFLVTTSIDIGRIQRKLYTEMYQYPEGSKILVNGNILFPNNKVVDYIKNN